MVESKSEMAFEPKNEEEIGNNTMEEDEETMPETETNNEVTEDLQPSTLRNVGNETRLVTVWERIERYVQWTIRAAFLLFAIYYIFISSVEVCNCKMVSVPPEFSGPYDIYENVDMERMQSDIHYMRRCHDLCSWLVWTSGKMYWNPLCQTEYGERRFDILIYVKPYFMDTWELLEERVSVCCVDGAAEFCPGKLILEVDYYDTKDSEYIDQYFGENQ